MSEEPQQIFLSLPHMSGAEAELVQEVIASNWVAPIGPMLKRFEDDFSAYTECGHAVAVTSGTAAIHLGLDLLGVGSGDKVLCPSMAFIAAANPVIYQGAEPVFIDCDSKTWNIDTDLLEEEILRMRKAGEKPKAIIAVHIGGQAADMNRIMALSAEHEIPVIEDSAESLGTTLEGKHVGTFADVGAFSFNGNKIITTSGGGMLVSKSKEYTDLARHLSTQARDPGPHYYHSRIGYNYRLSNVLAAIGVGQLQHIEDRVSRRRAVFNNYEKAFESQPGLSLQGELPNSRSNRWLTIARLDQEKTGRSRDALLGHLNENKIDARSIWMPLHMLPVFEDCRVVGGQVAEEVFSSALCLPSGSSLTDADQSRITGLVQDCLGR